MSLYAVKNDEGKWLYSDEYNDLVDQLSQATFYDTFEDADDDIEYWELSNAYAVELVEAPVKVVVSQEEAEMLEQAKDDYCAASVISAYSTDHIGAMGQDRLMRAYVNGWEIEKPKRYLIKVPHTDDSYFYKINDEYCNAGDSYHLEAMTDKKWFNLAEIEHYELTDCERVEVNDDEQ